MLEQGVICNTIKSFPDRTYNDVTSVLVSPHADDVALSIGGSILTGKISPPHVLLTVFCHSQFAPYLNSDHRWSQITRRIKRKDSWVEITKQRKTEDLSFSRNIGAKLVWLHFPDTTLRNYRDQHAVHSVSNAEEDPIFHVTYFVLKRFMRNFKNASIYCPSGIGNHVDHLIVRKCIVGIAKELDLKLSLYEDLPYASKEELPSIQKLNTGPDNRSSFEDVDITETMAQKVTNLLMYRSQLGPTEAEMVKSHARRLSNEKDKFFERIWNHAV